MLRASPKPTLLGGILPVQVTASPHICDEMALLNLAREKHILSTHGEGSQDGVLRRYKRERGKKLMLVFVGHLVFFCVSVRRESIWSYSPNKTAYFHGWQLIRHQEILHESSQKTRPFPQSIPDCSGCRDITKTEICIYRENIRMKEILFIYLDPHLKTWLMILEKGEGRERGKEKHRCRDIS